VSRRLKLAVLLAALSALGAVAATVAVGLSVREETVVAHPYEEGVRWSERGARLAAEAACDPGRTRCAAPLAGGGALALELAPRPVRTMADLDVVAEPTGVPAGAEVKVSFAMEGMSMGTNEVRLAPSAPGRWSGRAVLVRCPSGRKDWVADVTVTPPGEPPRTARFRLRAEE
jgi:hypothetical protein